MKSPIVIKEVLTKISNSYCKFLDDQLWKIEGRKLTNKANQWKWTAGDKWKLPAKIGEPGLIEKNPEMKTRTTPGNNKKRKI